MCVATTNDIYYAFFIFFQRVERFFVAAPRFLPPLVLPSVVCPIFSPSAVSWNLNFLSLLRAALSRRVARALLFNCCREGGGNRLGFPHSNAPAAHAELQGRAEQLICLPKEHNEWVFYIYFIKLINSINENKTKLYRSVCDSEM